MSGVFQHEIPQLFQRGFLIHSRDDSERVFVFRRGGNIFPSNINRSGGERYFYSTPSLDNSPTLDDSITRYESRLTALVNQLRAIPIGGIAQPDIAAEVITHLTTRNAHIRGAFSHGIKVTAEKISEAFGHRDTLLYILGLDESQPGEKFRKIFNEEIKKDPRFSNICVSENVLVRVAFFLAKENFENSANEFVGFLNEFARRLLNEAKSLAAHSHKKALAQSLVPDIRASTLRKFIWQVHSSSQDLILPDCVSIALGQDGDDHPLMMIDHDKIRVVLLPLTSRTILVGIHDESVLFDIGNFNQLAANCSHNYFVCASRSATNETLVSCIGRRSVVVVEEALSNGINEFLLSPPPLPRSPSSDPHLPPSDTPVIQPANIGISSPSWSINVRFLGNFNQDIANQIGKELREVLGEASWTIPLSRLDGITFADDYVEALRAIDRGFQATSPLKTLQNDSFVGVAQCPMVLRDGVIKGHIVCAGWIARELVGENKLLKVTAKHVLGHQLALVGVIQIFDETLPGILLKPFNDRFESDLHACVYPAWHGYFAARGSAKFVPEQANSFCEAAVTALNHAEHEIPAKRLAYRTHGDLHRLMGEISPHVRWILECVANCLGHADGLDRSALLDETLANTLKQMELLAWANDFHLQLNELWNRRGAWDSFDEFLALNHHTERILWRFGIFPWRKDAHQYQIEIPLASDIQALTKVTDRITPTE